MRFFIKFIAGAELRVWRLYSVSYHRFGSVKQPRELIKFDIVDGVETSEFCVASVRYYERFTILLFYGDATATTHCQRFDTFDLIGDFS